MKRQTEKYYLLIYYETKTPFIHWKSKTDKLSEQGMGQSVS
jgi:hypothetical protein